MATSDGGVEQNHAAALPERGDDDAVTLQQGSVRTTVGAPHGFDGIGQGRRVQTSDAQLLVKWHLEWDGGRHWIVTAIVAAADWLRW